MQTFTFVARSFIFYALILSGVPTPIQALAPESSWKLEKGALKDLLNEFLEPQRFWKTKRAPEEIIRKVDALHEKMRQIEIKIDDLLKPLRNNFTTSEIRENLTYIDDRLGIWITGAWNSPRILLRDEDSRPPADNAIFLLRRLSQHPALMPIYQMAKKYPNRFGESYWTNYFTLSQESGKHQTDIGELLKPLDSLGFMNPLSPNFKEDLKKNTFETGSLSADHIFRWLYVRGEENVYTAESPVSETLLSELLTHLSVYDTTLTSVPDAQNKVAILNALRRSLFYSDAMPREVRRHFRLMIATFFWNKGLAHLSAPLNFKNVADIQAEKFYAHLSQHVAETTKKEIPVLLPIDPSCKSPEEFLSLKVPKGTRVTVYFSGPNQRPRPGFFSAIGTTGNNNWLQLTDLPFSSAITAFHRSDIAYIQISENGAQKIRDLLSTSA